MTDDTGTLGVMGSSDLLIPFWPGCFPGPMLSEPAAVLPPLARGAARHLARSRPGLPALGGQGEPPPFPMPILSPACGTGYTPRSYTNDLKDILEDHLEELFKVYY